MDIGRTAWLCIKQHGPSAAYYAAGRADELLEAGALEGAKVWRRVLRAIEHLQAIEPTSTLKH